MHVRAGASVVGVGMSASAAKRPAFGCGKDLFFRRQGAPGCHRFDQVRCGGMHKERAALIGEQFLGIARNEGVCFVQRLAGLQEIAQLAQRLMRPMIKQWLDDHLPEMVERLVQAEIKRISRQGRDS